MIDKPVEGVKTDTRPHPSGAKGAKLSLKEVAERSWKARMSPRVRAWVMQVLAAAGVSTGGRREKAQAILDAVRKKVPYIADPVMGEFIASPEQTLCLDDGNLCFVGGDCFPEGTLLLRDDFEFVPIEQIKVGDRIWGHDKWTRVERKWFKGVLPVDAIDMNNGSTVCLTSGHKVYVKRQGAFERIHVRDLQEGDVLLQPDRVAFGVRDVDPGRMYVEALALADGWVEYSKAADHHGLRFRIAGRDGKRKEAQKHEVKEICARLGVPTHWHARYITIKDETWAQRIAELGSYARFKHLETINLTENSAKAALRGIMADSAANTCGVGRTYSTTSRMLMLQARVLHRMFGKQTGVRMLTPAQHGGAGEYPLWRVGVREHRPGQLAVTSVERDVRKVPCWDIATEDHYVYLPEHDVTVSNCDDFAVTLAAAMMSIGIPAMIIGSSHREPYDVPSHVYMAFEDELGAWIPMDGTTKLPAGKAPPHSREFWVEPGAEAKDRGEGDFVGMSGHEGTLGSPPSVSDFLYPHIR